MVLGVELILSLVKETLLQSELQRRVTKASEWGEIFTCQLSGTGSVALEGISLQPSS